VALGVVVGRVSIANELSVRMKDKSDGTEITVVTLTLTLVEMSSETEEGPSGKLTDSELELETGGGGATDELGGPTGGSLEELGGTGGSLEELGGTGGSLEELGGTGGSLEELGGTGSSVLDGIIVMSIVELGKVITMDDGIRVIPPSVDDDDGGGVGVSDTSTVDDGGGGGVGVSDSSAVDEGGFVGKDETCSELDGSGPRILDKRLDKMLDKPPSGDSEGVAEADGDGVTTSDSEATVDDGVTETDSSAELDGPAGSLVGALALSLAGLLGSMETAGGKNVEAELEGDETGSSTGSACLRPRDLRAAELWDEERTA
jgi:hypothetical protein